MKVGSSWVAAVSTAVAALILFTGQAIVPAMAEPTDNVSSVADAKSRLKDLEQQASEIGENYDKAEDALAAGEKKLSVIKADIALQQKKVDALNDAARTIALAQFRSRDLDTTVQIFTSGDPSTLLDRLSTANKVDENMADTLAQHQAEQANLADLQRAEAAEVKALDDQKQKLADLKSQIEGKVSQAKATYKQLSAPERQSVDSSDGSKVSIDPSTYAGASAAVKGAIAYAVSKVPNSSYVWGADGPNSFDCSGLMLAAYRSVGISLPHSSQAQSHLGKAVSRDDLQPGDLIFFYSPVHHVGMYIGNGMFVHARNPRVGLAIQSVSGYGAPWAGARRIVG